MLFTSLEFLFFFFPVLGLGVYFLLPNKFRNYWLLCISLLFYAWGEPKFVFIMLFSIIFNYLFALRIEELPTGKEKKIILALAVLANIGLLFVFKYMNFATGIILDISPSILSIKEPTKIVLPIGISFFTFQAMSYVIDVYRGIPAQKNLGYLGLYISFFPQLIAGPIVRYTTIMEQIDKREITREGVATGFLRFLYGFNKKVLLSNVLAEVADAAFNTSGELSVSMAWLGALSYTLQIFFDFSGYSEMAIGLGGIFGFHFLENFNYPYISKTITEFWRRWHISLGSWFRDYVYFPLGGSRVKSTRRLVFNLGVVWLITGVWHGASWNFILWGMLHGTVVILEKIFHIPYRIEENRIVEQLYRCFSMLVVILGWVLFRAENLSQGKIYYESMLSLNRNAVLDSNFLFYVREYAIVLLVAILLSTPILKIIKGKVVKYNICLGDLMNNFGYIIQFMLFLVSISYLVMNAHNPFIYFNF